MLSFFSNFKNMAITLLLFIIIILIITLTVSDSKIKNLKLENADLEISLTRYKDALNLQNNLILANKQDAKKVTELPKVVHDIQTKTITVTKEIIKFVEDKNVSKNDCNATVDFINNFDFSL
jgi:GTPase involved in cell partitioning and DNA repair